MMEQVLLTLKVRKEGRTVEEGYIDLVGNVLGSVLENIENVGTRFGILESIEYSKRVDKGFLKEEEVDKEREFSVLEFRTAVKELKEWITLLSFVSSDVAREQLEVGWNSKSKRVELIDRSSGC